MQPNQNRKEKGIDESFIKTLSFRPKKSLNQRKQEFCKRVGHNYTPTVALSFVFIYWAIGLKNAQYY